MNAQELLSALEGHFRRQASDAADREARFALAEGDWLVALCSAQDTAAEHLYAFEGAMQLLLDEREKGSARLGLAVDVVAIENGEQPSYRKALKKYSRSIVFEDIGITLLLVGADRVTSLEPQQVTPFLGDLDRNLRNR